MPQTRHGRSPSTTDFFAKFHLTPFTLLSRGLPRGVALSLCRVFLRNDVAERTVVNVAVVFIARANIAVAL